MRANWLVLALSIAALGCSGSLSQSGKADHSLVPHKTQKRAGELQGTQQQMMTDLNSTTAEQAASHHMAKTLPPENPKYSTKED